MAKRLRESLDDTAVVERLCSYLVSHDGIHHRRKLLDNAALALRAMMPRPPAVFAPPAAGPGNGSLPALEKLAHSLDWGRPQVGDMPACPHTLRARVGAVVIRSIRRALFWYSAQIVAFQRLVADAASEQARTLQDMEERLKRAEAECAAAKAEAAALRAELAGVAGTAGVPAHGLDVLLARHAEEFRGSPVEIRERLRVHLPRARDAHATAGAPVLDLGCGRGEWLSLMQEESIPAEGVEANEELAARCAEAGFRVTAGDLLEYLRAAPGESRSVVTAFHVIEHLPFAQLAEVLSETARVLKPGGIAILETPNARNLQVAAYNFYLDPTHLRPVPSELLAMLARASGLTVLEILSLQPYPDSHRIADDGSAATKLLNDLLFGPQDYALIAGKQTA